MVGLEKKIISKKGMLMSKVEIWVCPHDAKWWMTDKNGTHVYQMNFAYRETPTYCKKVILNFDPKKGEGASPRDVVDSYPLRYEYESRN